MAQDHIRYDILAQDALRSVIRKVLSEVAVTGHLPGEHLEDVHDEAAQVKD